MQTIVRFAILVTALMSGTACATMSASAAASKNPFTNYSIVHRNANAGDYAVMETMKNGKIIHIRQEIYKTEGFDVVIKTMEPGYPPAYSKMNAFGHIKTSAYAKSDEDERHARRQAYDTEEGQVFEIKLIVINTPSIVDTKLGKLRVDEIALIDSNVMIDGVVKRVVTLCLMDRRQIAFGVAECTISDKANYKKTLKKFQGYPDASFYHTWTKEFGGRKLKLIDFKLQK